MEERNITDGNAGAFVQFVGDNLDHNIATLNGKGTFHGMAIIAVSSRQRKDEERITRLAERLDASSYSSSCGIPIHSYNRSSIIPGESMFLKPVKPNRGTGNDDHIKVCNFLWHCGWFFQAMNYQGLCGRGSWKNQQHQLLKYIVDRTLSFFQ